MGRLRAHHRRRDLRRALSSALAPLAISAILLGCDVRTDPPLPPPRLEEREARLAAVRARLGELEAADGGVAVALLRHEDHRVRRAAALRLMEMGPGAADAMPELAGLLADDEPRVRTAAARALGAIGDPRAIDPLLSALADPDRSVRLWAWKAMRRLGDPAMPVLAAALAEGVPALQRSYRDETGVERTVRDELIARLPSIGAPIVPALGPALRGGAEGRAVAFEVLRRLGAQAKEALPELAAIIQDEAGDSATRILALLAVEAIGDLDPTVLPAVSDATRSQDPKVAARAQKTRDALERAAATAKAAPKKAKHGARRDEAKPADPAVER
jgi:HEAT repeat protein